MNHYPVPVRVIPSLTLQSSLMLSPPSGSLAFAKFLAKQLRASALSLLAPMTLLTSNTLAAFNGLQVIMLSQLDEQK